MGWFNAMINGIFSSVGAYTYEREGSNHVYMPYTANQIDDLDLDNLLLVYWAIPQLRAVIDKKARYISNGIPEVVGLDSQNNEVVYPNHPLTKTLQRPNYLQTMQAFLYMISVIKSITGDAFILPVGGINAKRARNLESLWGLTFNKFQVKVKDNIKIHETKAIEEYIDKYIFYYSEGPNKIEKKFEVKPEDIIHLRDYGASYEQSKSRINNLEINIQNIYKALMARGVLAGRQGGIGILSTAAQKDEFQSIKFGKGEQESIERRLNQTNMIGNSGILVSGASLNFQRTAIPTKDLMLFEEIEDDFNTICDQFELDRETFNGDVKFSNKEIADRNNYQNAVIPEWMNIADSLTNFFDLMESEGKWIRFNTDHIPVLQEDEKTREETLKMKSERLIAELERDIITIDEYNEQMYGK